MIKTYQEKKAETIEKAIEFVNNFENIENWGDYIRTKNRLEKLAKRYGLVREFKENVII